MTCKEILFPMRFKGADIKVHVLIYGSNDSSNQILCLHGFANNARINFEKFAGFMDGYYLVAIDWIGYGESSKPLRKIDTYDTPYMTSFLMQFIRSAIRKGILRKRFDILANSMSGIAVTKSYASLERYVEKIVFVNPAGFDRRINMKFSISLVNPLIRRKNFRKIIINRLSTGKLFGWTASQKRRLTKVLLSDEFEVYLRATKAGIRPRGRIKNTYRCTHPEKIKVPVLMVASRKDSLMRWQRYLRVAKRNRWQIAMIDYYDHALMISRPKQVAQAVKKFIV